MTKSRRLAQFWRRRAAGSAALGISLACGSVAAAESALRLPVPVQLAMVQVATYDADARSRIGDGIAGWEAVDGGRVRFRAISRIDGGQRTEASALFEAVEDRLRPLRQESRSYSEAGELVGQLIVDHEARRASCERAGKPRVTLELPDPDRVANVIVGGAVAQVLAAADRGPALQVFLCRLGGRVVDARASVAHRIPWGTRELVEVQLEADLGPLVRWALGRWLPRFSLWLDSDGPHWVAHRIPLYPRAPTVTVMRSDIAERLAVQIRR